MAWGCKPKNLDISRGNLQVFFSYGGKPKDAHMAGGKNILTLKTMVLVMEEMQG
jgi:hypothetical protein